MKVIVLGATGMLGSYTALALKKVGHEVVAVARRTNDNGFFSGLGIAFIGGWDITDTSTYSSLPCDAECIVNMAGYMPAHGDASPMPYVKSIVEGTVNLCEWMKTTQCRRIIFNTTPADISNHFGDGTPVDDDAVRSFPRSGNDHSVYAICKIAATDILRYYELAYGFKPCVFRHMTVFGWHPDDGFNIDGRRTVSPWRQIMAKCTAGETIEVWGAPEHRVELLYIDDFTDAVLCAMNSEATGLFNLPGVRPYSLEEEFRAIAEVFSPMGKNHPIVLRPDKPVGPSAVLAGDKSRRQLGWMPRVEWPEACRRMKAAMSHSELEGLWATK